MAVDKGLLAHATWIDLEATIKTIEAATIRGDTRTVAAGRERAHGLLDAHLDLKTDALTEVLRGLKR